MIVAVWIVSALLAVVNLGAGIFKVVTPKAKLPRPQLAWVDDYSQSAVTAIGVLEVLAAIGLILPPLTGIAPVLAALAAMGLVLLQIGALVVHLRRGERQTLPINVVLIVLAAFVALARFGAFGTL